MTAGVAVATTLKSYGCAPGIKWVNDVLLGGKKVCGILAEAVSGTSLCVIGIGINLDDDALPPELDGIAAGLDRYIANVPSPEVIVSDVISEYDRLEGLDRRDVISEYKSFLSFLGKRVIIKETDEVCTALDVDERGGLVVKTGGGSVRHLSSGEISILTV